MLHRHDQTATIRDAGQHAIIHGVIGVKAIAAKIPSAPDQLPAAFIHHHLARLVDEPLHGREVVIIKGALLHSVSHVIAGLAGVVLARANHHTGDGRKGAQDFAIFRPVDFPKLVAIKFERVMLAIAGEFSFEHRKHRSRQRNLVVDNANQQARLRRIIALPLKRLPIAGNLPAQVGIGGNSARRHFGIRRQPADISQDKRNVLTVFFVTGHVLLAAAHADAGGGIFEAG